MKQYYFLKKKKNKGYIYKKDLESADSKNEMSL